MSMFLYPKEFTERDTVYMQHPMGNFPVEVDVRTTQLDSVKLLAGARLIKIAVH